MIKRDLSRTPTIGEVEQFLADQKWMIGRAQKIAKHLGHGCQEVEFDSENGVFTVKWVIRAHASCCPDEDYSKDIPMDYLWTMDDDIIKLEEDRKKKTEEKEIERQRLLRIKSAADQLVAAQKRAATAKEDAEKEVQKAKEALARLSK